MPNIIINNYCNQKCKYCFAEDNMSSKIKNDMNILTFLKILKYLKFNKDNNIRILWWEPLLSKNIKSFLSIWLKWWFNIIIFSNINISNEKIKNIFDSIDFKWKLRINCNINNPNFYSNEELENINQNLKYFQIIWVKLILWYNIYDLNKKADFIFTLAKKHNINAINLKITNSSIWEKLIIDNSNRNLWFYIIEIIKKYHKSFFIEFSCWLDKNIFKENELYFIKNNTKIKLKFWCEWNIWKFDINTDWTIFKCFPLKNIYINNYKDINYLLENNIKIIENINYLTNNFWKNYSIWECIANKKIKDTKYI